MRASVEPRPEVLACMLHHNLQHLLPQAVVIASDISVWSVEGAGGGQCKSR
jgi:hypothetical protein